MSTVVYLNGVNINKYVVEGSLNIDDAIGERSTCQFDIRCPACALNLVVGARVEVYTDNIKVFGGTIDNIDKIELLGTNPRYLQFSVQCSDWHQICDRRIVSEAYENMAAGDIVQSLIQNYLASEGIIGNPADPTFTRNSVAYKSDSTQVAANVPRFEPGKFGQAVMVEEGTTNLVNANPQNYTLADWGGKTGATIVDGTTPWGTPYRGIVPATTSSANLLIISPTFTLSSPAGKVYTGSVVWKGPTPKLSLRSNDGVYYQTAMVIEIATMPDGWKRGYYVFSAVPSNYTGTTKFTFLLRTTQKTETILFTMPQLEQKPYATSFIDGTRADEKLTIPIEVLNHNAFTFEMWIKQSIVTTSAFSHGKRLLDLGQGLWLWNHSPAWPDLQGMNRRIIADFGQNASGTRQHLDLISQTPFSTVNFEYFAVTFDGATFRFYRNGVLWNSKTPSKINPFTQIVLSNAGWIIDDIRVSSRARSDEEILAAYQSGQPLPVDEWTTYKLDFDDNINNSAISIQNGPIIQQAVFNYVPATQCLDKLADLAGYTWWIDSSKRLHFCDRALYQAPFVIDEQSKIMRPKLSSNRDNYRNRQYIRAGKGTTDPQTEIFKGNGVQKTFTVGFPIAKVPTIKVNGVTQTVGIKGVDTGKDWYWNKGDPVITQDDAATPLSETDTLQITYQGFYDIIVLTDDYSAVLERQSVEGGTGLYEAVNEEPYAETSEAAFQSANALLKKYAKLGQVLSFDTLLTGFRAGQLLQVNLPVLGAVGEYLIRKVQYRDMPGDKYDYLFSVEAVSCFAAETWAKFFKSNLGQPKTYVIRENIQEQEVLIRLVQQSEQAAWAEEVMQMVFACPIPSDELYPSDTLYPC